jgi:opacity protein-like surface antigen
MLYKRLLMASSAVALLATTGSAQAETWYYSVFGGVNLQNDTSGFQSTVTTFATPATFFDIDAKTGFVMGAAVGVKLNEAVAGLRLEGEVSYRENNLGGRHSTTVTGTFAGPHDGNVSTFALMANAWYDVDFGMGFTPYLGGGVGWGRSNADGFFRGVWATSGNIRYDFEESGFVWQAGAGVKYPIADGVTLGVEYRYFRGPDIDNNVFLGKNALPVDFERDNHAVQLNLAFDLN